MRLKDDFEKATQDVKNLSRRPADGELLELYALYKQAVDGDVSGSRPGFLDLKGRAKFDAWTKKKGMSTDEAMVSYTAFAKTLISRLS